MLKAFWNKIEPCLVEDWKSAYKWVSFWIYVIIGVAASIPYALPSLQAYVPEDYLTILAVVGILARLIKQSEVKNLFTSSANKKADDIIDSVVGDAVGRTQEEKITSKTVEIAQDIVKVSSVVNDLKAKEKLDK